jgi:soluble lytic murein transglycosylase
VKRAVAGIVGLALVVLIGWLVLGTFMPGWYGRHAYRLEHAGAIRESAARNDLDPALVAAVIHTESGFRDDVSSHRGAVGLMQVMPSTALEIAKRTGGKEFVIGDLTDPEVNIAYGSFYLRELLDRYAGSEIAAIAAYNAGQGNVDAWRDAALAAGHELRAQDIPFAETRAYVARVERARDVYRRAWASELGLPE